MSRRVIIFFYRLLLAISFPLLLLYLLVRIARDRRYLHKLSERFGSLPFQPTQRGGVWFHAVSVGEVLSVVALLKQMKQQLPGTPCYVSVTTLAGRALAGERLAGLADGIFYAPLDYAFIVRRVLRRLDPLAVVILETEIWPNLWNETRRRQAALLVLNGRISDKAFPRYRRWRHAFAPILQLPYRIYAQSENDAGRYRQLGATHVSAAGNLKYDIAVPAPHAEIQQWIAQQKATKLFIAASTMPAVTPEDREEDDIVLDAFTEAARSITGLLMILAPRRPELFAQAAAKIHQRKINFARRTKLENINLPGVLLLDSMGELAGLYELADAVFVGGSLVHWGGHNVLEPAASQRPILVGPHMQNFAGIAEEFHAAQALIPVPTPAHLGAILTATLHHPGPSGPRAQTLARKHQGATTQAVQTIIQALDAHVSQEPGRRYLAPFAWLYHAGLAFDRRRRTNRTPLAKPVISIGNLTTGGTGKTPLVDWITRQLPHTAILTRGYGRQTNQPLILPPGAGAPAAQTGDEAQIYLRAAQATVGIGANRRAVAGQINSQTNSVERFLLDDGFQHWPLPRNLDIVLLDTTDPFGGGHLLPRGRLRETPQALLRADLIILTRTEPNRTYAELQKRLPVPAFRARTQPVAWHPGPLPAGSMPPSSPPTCSLLTNSLPPGPYTAVCGLANPSAFARSLRQLQIEPKRFLAFPDHHAYTPRDFAGIANPILTTEKDWAKIQNLRLDVPIFWLEIQLELDAPQELLRRISEAGAKRS